MCSEAEIQAEIDKRIDKRVRERLAAEDRFFLSVMTPAELQAYWEPHNRYFRLLAEAQALTIARR